MNKNIFGAMLKTVDFYLSVHARLCAGKRYQWALKANINDSWTENETFH